MLSEWHEFYALLGTAAAALVALLFVAVSVGASVLTPQRASATRTFMSPVVFHYSNILFLSLVMLVPGQTSKLLGAIIAVAAVGSLVYSVVIVVRVFRSHAADLADRLAYGSVPMVSYAAGIVVAWLLLTGRAAAGLNLLAGAALLLLLINIRNAWDVMLALARHTAAQQRGGDSANQPPSP